MSSEIKCEEIQIPLRTGNIAACWYGDRKERPILATHGWQDNAGSFALLAPKLSRHVAILAIDLPGHGRSSHFPTGLIYHTSDYVRVIREIMFYYKWPKISLIAHSMSSAVTYNFVALFPETVDMVVSIDVLHTRYFSLDHQINMIKFCVDKFLIETERKVNNEIENTEPPCYSFAELEKIMYEASERSVVLDKAKFILQRNITVSKNHSNKYYFSRDGGIKCLMETYTEPELTQAMARRMCNIKWLVLKAEDSDYIDDEHPTTRAVLQILKENNPDFFLYKIPGVKHHCHLTDVEKVEKYIVPFVKKYRPPEYFNYGEMSKL